MISLLTEWASEYPTWNLIEGLFMLTRPSNRRCTRPNSPKRAPFIVLEGNDASGKTAHAEAVSQALCEQGLPVQRLIFPNNRTPLGRFLKQKIQECSDLDTWVLHILFSLHRWEHQGYIVDHLLEGTAVVCERYVWSGVAYALLNNLSIPIETYMMCDKGVIKPDLVILMDDVLENQTMTRNLVPPQFDDWEVQRRIFEYT